MVFNETRVDLAWKRKVKGILESILFASKTSINRKTDGDL